jgi:diguanylate cyclase (GGDEF)-like protein
MRLIGRNDLFLLIGLTVALFAIFSRPLARVLDYAHQVDQSRGFQLLPGLVILAVVFMFHQVRKRDEVRAEALAAAAAVREAAARAAETERLLAFGQALARSLDYEGIKAAVTKYLAGFSDGRGWAMVRSADGWQPLTPIDDVRRRQLERAADGALDGGHSPLDAPSDDIRFPMIVAGTVIGVLGVSSDPPLTDHHRATLAAAAALLAVSLKNAELFQTIHDNSVRDALTGCYNRKHALDVIDAELRRSRRSQLPLALLMFDLDHFKAINDRHGHLCGDAVLAAVGQRMKTVLRASDLKCRYGGEEFLVLLPETTASGASKVAELLRRDLEAHPVAWNGEAIPVTASFGVAVVKPGEGDTSAVIGRADAALYRAKENGRNMVCLAEAEELVT